MAPVLHVGDLIPYLTVYNVATLSIAACAFSVASICIYNIYLHPLSKYPGPKGAACTQLFHSRDWLGGDYPRAMKRLHDKYGPVVRTGPNQLSYSTATSWKDIYGHVGGRKQFPKSGFYSDERAANIVSERDPHKHGIMRRTLSHGFSAKALAEQEDLVQEYVDRLISQINIHATGEAGANMVQWYNFTTFDIIGDLAFGDPFGCLENGKPHFWISMIMDSFKAGAWISVLSRYPYLIGLLPRLVPKKMMDARNKHMQFSEDKVVKRMAAKTVRRDLLSGLVMKQETDEKRTVEEMASQAQVLIIAGSETTATVLSGLSYCLLHDPSKYQRLVEEIRGAFSSYSEIDGMSTDRLPYLKAVIEEGLRVYPVVPFGLPRLSPGETVDGVFVPKGTEVFTSAYAATHSADNFHRPFDFLPERWMDPACEDKKNASQPFSIGSRGCIGRSLALMELRIILTKMLWSYDMHSVNPEFDWIANQQAYLLWEKPALNLRYTRRAGITVPPLDG